MASRKHQKRRIEQRRQSRQAPARQTAGSREDGPHRSWWWLVVLLVALMLAIGGGIALAIQHEHVAGAPATPSPVPATSTPASVSQAGTQTVDGISCDAMENLAYHIHQHLTLYDHGRQVQVPSEIGIPGGEQQASCFYWIHVHAFTPNIIHVESPLQKTFHLGNFFDIWHATASSAQPSGDAYVQRLRRAAARGQVTAFLNGKRWTHGYRSVPLEEHGVITVEIGKPVVPPRPFNQWDGL